MEKGFSSPGEFSLSRISRAKEGCTALRERQVMEVLPVVTYVEWNNNNN